MAKALLPSKVRPFNGVHYEMRRRKYIHMLNFVYEDDMRILKNILWLYSDFISVQWNHQQASPVSWDYPFNASTKNVCILSLTVGYCIIFLIIIHKMQWIFRYVTLSRLLLNLDFVIRSKMDLSRAAFHLPGLTSQNCQICGAGILYWKFDIPLAWLKISTLARGEQLMLARHRR
jgi:hypothetical protein